MAVIPGPHLTARGKWSEPKVIWILATSWNFLTHYRRNLVVVPNVASFFNDHEADLLVVSRAGYLTEVEVKVSASDWRQDKHKSKFGKDIYGNQKTGSHATGTVKYFYYAAPLELARRWEEMGIPDWAGVIAVSERDGGGYHAEVIRAAKASPEPKKLADKRLLFLARLGCMRVWDILERQHVHPLQPPGDAI